MAKNKRDVQEQNEQQSEKVQEPAPEVASVPEPAPEIEVPAPLVSKAPVYRPLPRR